MPFEAIWIVAAVIAMFATFGVAVAYVNAIAGTRAITFDEEQAARLAFAEEAGAVIPIRPAPPSAPAPMRKAS